MPEEAQFIEVDFIKYGHCLKKRSKQDFQTIQRGTYVLHKFYEQYNLLIEN